MGDAGCTVERLRADPLFTADIPAAHWIEENPDGRRRCYGYDEIQKRDKLSLDLFWVKDQSLTDTDSLPPPDILAAEIADELESAFDLFTKIAAKPPKSAS